MHKSQGRRAVSRVWDEIPEQEMIIKSSRHSVGREKETRLMRAKPASQQSNRAEVPEGPR